MNQLDSAASGRFRLVTFDAHNTLIAPHPGIGAVYAEVARTYGLDRDVAFLDAQFPTAFRTTHAEWPVPYGADEADARAFWIRVVERTFAEPLPHEFAWECYDTFATAERWRVLPGVRETLAGIAARGLPLAVISNFDARLPPLLAALGLGPFATVVVSATLGTAKPDPATLQPLLRQFACSAAEVLHIGDSEREDGGLCQASGAHWFPVAPGAGISLAAVLAKLDGW